ncbi:MAG: hypothetical protein ABI662_09490 [Dermatophilaceae bacterium]
MTHLELLQEIAAKQARRQAVDHNGHPLTHERDVFTYDDRGRLVSHTSGARLPNPTEAKRLTDLETEAEAARAELAAANAALAALSTTP